MVRGRLTTTMAATAALLLSTAGAASAGEPTVLTDEVLGPFNIAVDDGGVYVADGFTSTISRIRSTGLETKATGPDPGDVAGLAFNRSGDTMAYTTTSYENGTSTLTIKHGDTTEVVDLSAFESNRNPDKRNEYGINNASQCVKDALGEFAEYTGIVESHPYAVTAWKDGWIVADAAGNDLLEVDEDGDVSVLAVLPTQPEKITQEMADHEGLPSCVVGETYRFEPVPTDVEWGPDGKLYVTTLPGGPEDPSFGDRGSVYKVDPSSGDTDRIATGFAGATNLAVAPGGKIYVAELFGGQISTIKDGKPHAWMSLEGALAVEYSDGHLYASTMAQMDDTGNITAPGTVVKLT